jgi:hypothetical protein
MPPRGLSRVWNSCTYMIKKKQMVLEAGEEGLSAVKQFYSLAA